MLQPSLYSIPSGTIATIITSLEMRQVLTLRPEQQNQPGILRSSIQILRSTAIFTELSVKIGYGSIGSCSMIASSAQSLDLLMSKSIN